MTPLEIKDYIIEKNKQIDVLEKLGCHHIKEHKKYYTCGRPNGQKNNVGIQMYKDNLKVKIFTPDLQISKHYKEKNADILTLVMIINDCSFVMANKWMHESLSLKYDGYKPPKEKTKSNNYLDIFTKHLKNRCDVQEDLEMINNEILSDFIPHIHIDWVKDGITPNIGEEFGIGFSERRKRIIIPHRYWCGEKDDYVGIIGRSTVEDEIRELLNIPKYFPIKSYAKGLNLYGLNENYKYIIEKGFVCVYEAEKSTMKRASRLDRTGVSVCSHTLSDEQVKILIGLDVEVIIAYDSDVPEKLIWKECEKFYGIRKISYMFDRFGLLKEKEAPADKSEQIYQYLFNHRVKYDAEVRIRYLEEMER